MWKLLREYATSVSGLTEFRPRLSCTNNDLQPWKPSRIHSRRLSGTGIKVCKEERPDYATVVSAPNLRPWRCFHTAGCYSGGFNNVSLTCLWSISLPTSNAIPWKRHFKTSSGTFISCKCTREGNCLPFGWLGSVNSYFPIPTVRSIWSPFGLSWFPEAGVGWVVACPFVSGNAAEGKVGGCMSGCVMWPFPTTFWGVGWTTWPAVVRDDGVIGGWLVA